MLILQDLFRQQRDWYILLETTDGKLYPSKPFKGSNFQMEIYAQHLAEQAQMQGLPLAEIHIKAADLIKVD